MKRVAVVITARPSYARIKTALESLQARHVELDILCTASALLPKYGEVVKQIRADGFTVNREFHTLVEGDHHAAQAHTLALTTTQLAAHFADTTPHAVLVIADRYEVLSAAIAASYQHIPLVHVQGGEVTGNIDDKVRNAITQLADLHLVSSADAAHRVRWMNPEARIVVTGCPSLDLAATVDSTPIMALPGEGPELNLLEPFLLVLQHAVTDESHRATLQMKALQRAVDQVGLPVVWFWPNPDAGTEKVAKALRTWRPRVPVHKVRQVPPADFVRLMRQCMVMVGNSSAGIREGSFLGTPVVNIGSRQAGRARGPNVLDVAPEAPAIQRAIETWRKRERPAPSNLYGDGTGGLRIASAVLDWLTGRQTARRETWSPVPSVRAMNEGLSPNPIAMGGA